MLWVGKQFCGKLVTPKSTEASWAEELNAFFMGYASVGLCKNNPNSFSGRDQEQCFSASQSLHMCGVSVHAGQQWWQGWYTWVENITGFLILLGIYWGKRVLLFLRVFSSDFTLQIIFLFCSMSSFSHLHCFSPSLIVLSTVSLHHCLFSSCPCLKKKNPLSLLHSN